MPNKLSDLAKEIFSQISADANWILTAAYSKVRGKKETTGMTVRQKGTRTWCF